MGGKRRATNTRAPHRFLRHHPQQQLHRLHLPVDAAKRSPGTWWAQPAVPRGAGCGARCHRVGARAFPPLFGPPPPPPAAAAPAAPFLSWNVADWPWGSAVRLALVH
jgi:hypothetical protein